MKASTTFGNVPADLRSAGTLALLILIARTMLAFGFFTLHS